MECNKAYKFRLYPNNNQQVLLANMFGCVRLVFNYYLTKRKEAYETNKVSLSYKDNALDLVNLKKEKEFLKDCDSIALQQSLRHLDTSFKNFFNNPKNGYPKYKRKIDHNDSYSTVNVNNNILILDNKHIKLPKLGIVNAKIHREIPNTYKLKSATVSKNPSGQYFVSVLFEYEKTEIESTLDESKSIGLDYSMPQLFVSSDDNVVVDKEYLKIYRKRLLQLKKLQQTLSRRNCGNHKKNIQSSKRYIKQRIKVAKLHQHIKNIRRDYLDKLSTQIVKEYDIVSIESLNMQAMSKQLKYSKAVYDNSWGLFTTLLGYKLKEKGKKLIKIDKFYPSSKTCFNCGYKLTELDLNVRTWECPNCHSINDRDYNASLNIKKEGLRLHKS